MVIGGIGSSAAGTDLLVGVWADVLPMADFSAQSAELNSSSKRAAAVDETADFYIKGDVRALKCEEG